MSRSSLHHRPVFTAILHQSDVITTPAPHVVSLAPNEHGYYQYSYPFPALWTFSPNRPKWVHFCRALPHSAKKTPFPGIRKAGREQTLSGQMTLFLHFLSSKERLLLLPPHILTLYSSKHAKITTQASYQNLGGYMCLHQYIDTSYDYRLGRFRVCKERAATHLSAPP